MVGWFAFSGVRRVTLERTVLLGMPLLRLNVPAPRNERAAIRTRHAEGIAAAKRRRVRVGRAPKGDAADFAAANRLWRAGTLRAAEAAQALCVSRSTFYRHARACAAAEGQIFPARGGENA